MPPGRKHGRKRVQSRKRGYRAIRQALTAVRAPRHLCDVCEFGKMKRPHPRLLVFHNGYDDGYVFHDYCSDVCLQQGVQEHTLRGREYEVYPLLYQLSGGGASQRQQFSTLTTFSSEAAC